MQACQADEGEAAPSPPGASIHGSSNQPAVAPAREFLQQERKDPEDGAGESRYHFQPTGRLLSGIPSLLRPCQSGHLPLQLELAWLLSGVKCNKAT